MKKNCLQAIVLFTACLAAAAKSSDMPIVGVVMQPSTGLLEKILVNATRGFTYLSDSYVQQIRAAGGIPLLIPFDLPLDTLAGFLDVTSMLLIPGGPTYLIDEDYLPTPYQERIHLMIEYAKERNSRGLHYPIFATCLGFENLLISAAGQNTSVLQMG